MSKSIRSKLSTDEGQRTEIDLEYTTTLQEVVGLALAHFNYILHCWRATDLFSVISEIFF